MQINTKKQDLEFCSEKQTNLKKQIENNSKKIKILAEGISALKKSEDIDLLLQEKISTHNVQSVEAKQLSLLECLQNIFKSTISALKCRREIDDSAQLSYYSHSRINTNSTIDQDLNNSNNISSASRESEYEQRSRRNSYDEPMPAPYIFHPIIPPISYMEYPLRLIVEPYMENRSLVDISTTSNSHVTEESKWKGDFSTITEMSSSRESSGKSSQQSDASAQYEQKNDIYKEKLDKSAFNLASVPGASAHVQRIQNARARTATQVNRNALR